MKIYVVMRGDYNDYEIITATIDKDMAHAIAKKFDEEDFHTEVEEFEDAEVLLKPCWFVRFAKDGSVKECLCKSFDFHYYKFSNQCVVDISGGVAVSVIADDSSAAIKIATEKRVQYLAEKDGIE